MLPITGYLYNSQWAQVDTEAADGCSTVFR